MVGCTVPFCNNSSEKGYIMKILPKNTQRREKWIESINSKYNKWTPSNYSYLCEVHFEPEMWEQKRIDNKRKLKQNAIPTIFDYFIKKKIPFNDQKSDIIKREYNFVHKEDQIRVNDEQIIKNEAIELPPYTSLIMDTGYTLSNMDKECELIIDKSKAEITHTHTHNAQNIRNEKEVEERKRKELEERNIKRKEEINKKMAPRLILLRRKNKILRNKIQKLEDKIKNDKFRKALDIVFNEDQIKALCTKKRRTKYWCNKTIQCALRLKFTCGNNGYEELLQQKMPLPSLRTLQRRIENLKFKNGTLNDMFEFLQLKAASSQNTDKECGLVIDEMSITPKNVYDTSTKTLLGNITLSCEEDN